MKILFILEGDLDVRNWSGTTLSLYNVLSDHGMKVSPLEIHLPKYIRAINKWKRKVSNRSGDLSRGRLCMDYRRNRIQKALCQDDFDAIFCVGSIDASAIPENCGIPVYYYTDGTMAIMKGYYSEFSNWDFQTLKDAEDAELIAATNAQKTGGGILATSQWAADSFIRDYGVKRSSVYVVRIGGNHMKEYKSSDINRIISDRIQNIKSMLRILFVGVDWERKGGPDFLELCRMLKKKGIHYHADIAGCTPEIPNELKTDVEVHGFLSKANPAQKKILDALYQHAHFFILPTHAECTAVVFCESSAYALPSLSYQTGGLGSIIENGTNGFLFPLNNPVNMSDWVNFILMLQASPKKYRQLCLSSYDFANHELTWKSVGNKIVKIITERGTHAQQS